ncbi:hypothetical protein B0H19DRAFT_1082406 [Mycena capillaripes]|nr:hypothetical protein B0H19DRAFT_1082406 [Mycena capillaripes]
MTLVLKTSSEKMVYSFLRFESRPVFRVGSEVPEDGRSVPLSLKCHVKDLFNLADSRVQVLITRSVLWLSSRLVEAQSQVINVKFRNCSTQLSQQRKTNTPREIWVGGPGIGVQVGSGKERVVVPRRRSDSVTNGEGNLRFILPFHIVDLFGGYGNIAIGNVSPYSPPWRT